MKIAIVHDFLKEYGGAERVLEELHNLWPEAPIYTAFVDYEGLGPHKERIKKWEIKTSWVQKNWIVKKLHSPLRFLAPKIWSSFDFTGYEAVISSSSWYITKGIKVPEDCIHICYLHSVPRYLYGFETKMNWQKHFIIRWYGNIINHYLRMYDFKTSQKVDYFIANSEETKRRIWKFYRREAEVIYPPVKLIETVESKNIPNFSEEKDYYLCVNRLASAKHIEIAIKAANKMMLPLYVVGKGTEKKYLQSIAGKTVKFFGEVSDLELQKLYKNSKAYIFCAKDEDFGIAPVEAMGFGKPVIAYESGGVIETVIEGKTGVLFNELTEEALEGAIKRLQKITINKDECKKQAEKFSKENFAKKIRIILMKKIKKVKQ